MSKKDVLELLLRLIRYTEIRNVGSEYYPFYVLDRDDLIKKIEEEIENDA